MNLAVSGCPVRPTDDFTIEETPLSNDRSTGLTASDTAATAEAIARLSPEDMVLVASLIRQLSNGNGGAVKHRPHGVPADAFRHWITKMKSERFSETTIFVYRYLAERYIKRHPAPTKLDIQSYLAERLDGGISPAMVENERKALHSLFSFLRGEGLWHEDPTAGIKRVKVNWGNRRCPAVEDVEKVLKTDCCRARDTDKLKTLVILLATTGLRITEAASLAKDNIDFGALELRIRGKGDKYRVVPLLPVTAEALRGYMGKYPSESPFVFAGSTRTGYANTNNIEKTLKHACLRAGVEPFCPHQLRHFYATEMLRKGAKLEVVGRILGHSSIGITADIYRHVRTGEMHEEHLKFAPMNSIIEDFGQDPSYRH